MKRPPLATSIELLVFFLLLVGGLAILPPVSRRVQDGLQKLRSEVSDTVGRLTGLKVSYRALSPSVLRSIRLSGLALEDAETGMRVAAIENVSVSYNLWSLLRGRISGGLREILIENASISLDRDSNSAVVDSLRSLLENAGSGTDRSGLENTVLRVRLRNVDFSWKEADRSASIHIGRGGAEISSSGISFSAGARVRYREPSLPWLGSVSAQASLKGTLEDGFRSGSASLVVQTLDAKWFTVPKIALVTSFRNGIFEARSVQDLQPVDLRITFDPSKGNLAASLACERLLPFQWIRLKSDDPSLASLRSALLSGTVSLSLGKDGQARYAADLSADAPRRFYGGARLRFSASGDQERLRVTRLSVEGERYDISFAGSLGLRRFLPEGRLEVRKLALPGGARIAGDFSFSPSGSSSVCTVPELTVGSGSFTSVKATVTPRPGSVEFLFSAVDPHGRISAEGSWSTGKAAFLQLYATFDSVSVANGAGAALSVLGSSGARQGAELDRILAPYAITTELYVSTDFRQVSFNCPRLVLASEEKDGLYILLSAKGNESSIDVTDISFSRGTYAIDGNIHTSFEPSGDILFDSGFTVNAIPYNLSGMLSNGVLSLYGDYNLAVSAFFSPSGGVSGSFRTGGLPLPAGKMVFSLGLSADFVYDPATTWNVSIPEGSLEEMSGSFPLETQIRFSGSADSGGIVLERVTVSDSASLVSGYAGIRVNRGSDGFAGFLAEAELSSTDSAESYRFSGQVSRLADLYFQSSLAVTDAPVQRFTRSAQRGNLASVTLSCSGTPSDILASASVDRFRCQAGGYDLDVYGKLMLEDRSLSIYDAGLSWNGKTLSALKGSFSLDTLQAQLDADCSALVGTSALNAKLGVAFVPEVQKGLSGAAALKELSDRFTLKARLTDIRWKSLSSAGPFETVVVREPGITAVYAGTNDAVTGFLLDDGTFSLQAQDPCPVSLHADGRIEQKNLSIQMGDLHADMPKLWPYLNVPYLDIQRGSLDGGFTITGLLNDPDFEGVLKATGLEAVAPGLLAGSWKAGEIEIVAAGKLLKIPDFTVVSKDGTIQAGSEIEFDRWIPYSIRAHASTLPDSFIKLAADTSQLRAEGYLSCDLSFSSSPQAVAVSGEARMERGFIAVLLSGASKTPAAESANAPDLKVDMDFSFGKKLEFLWPSVDLPIIRGLLQADKPLQISLDTATNRFQLKGGANLRGGQIFYIKRNFYLRQGEIVFNENQDRFDPLITLRAEIRERDAAGEPVRIILSVNNQPLSSFTPVLSADPPKPDAEIMALLGQAASADTSRDTLLKNTVISASDILTQMSLFRNAENTIRDTLNLDIFSLRTLLLQNAIWGQTLQSSEDKPLTIGNYFDNTTVYMGKYLGSAVYADALLHFSYYDPKSAENAGTKQGVVGNLLFQPEIGLEMATPFFLLRWGIAPSSPETLFVADNSITLSWKFSY